MFDKTKQSFTYRDDLKTFENSSCKQRRFVNKSKVVVVFLLFVMHGFLHFSIVHCFFKCFLICMKINLGLFEIGQIIDRGANSVRTTGLRRSFYVKPIFSKLTTYISYVGTFALLFKRRICFLRINEKK